MSLPRIFYDARRDVVVYELCPEDARTLATELHSLGDQGWAIDAREIDSALMEPVRTWDPDDWFQGVGHGYNPLWWALTVELGVRVTDELIVPRRHKVRDLLFAANPREAVLAALGGVS